MSNIRRAKVVILATAIGGVILLVPFLTWPEAVEDRNKLIIEELKTDKFKKGVVYLLVEATDSRKITTKFKATGFLISDSGHLLTSKHLIPLESEYESITTTARLGDIDQEPPLAVELVNRSEHYDLALLKLEKMPSDATQISLGNPANSEEDDYLFAAGFPGGDYYSVTDGRLKSKRTIEADSLWRTELGVEYGNSGGPVFHENKVIAVVEGGYPGKQRKYIVPLVYSEGLLRKAGVTTWPWHIEANEYIPFLQSKAGQIVSTHKTTEDVRERSISEGKIMKVLELLNNSTETSQEYRFRLYEIEEALRAMRSFFSTKELENATAEVRNGNTDFAITLFNKVASGTDFEAAEANFQLGKIAENQLDYDKAYQFYEVAIGLESSEARFLEAGTRMAYATDDYAKALEWGESLVDTLRNEFGEKDATYAKARCELGETHRILNDEKTAITFCREAINILRYLPGQEYAVAEARNNLSVAYKRLGNYRLAAVELENARGLLEDAAEYDGMRNQKLLATVNSNLGSLFIRSGRHKEAHSLLEKAIEMDSSVLGVKHPYFGVDLASLGALYTALAQYSKAKEMYDGAIDIFSRALNLKNRYTARTLALKSVLSLILNNDQEAYDLAQNALSMQKEFSRGTSIRTAQAQFILAEIQSWRGQFDSAEMLLKRSFETLSTQDSHPDLVRLLLVESALQLKLGRLHRLKDLQNTMKRVAKKALEPNHPLHGEIDKASARIHLVEDNLEEAILSFESADKKFRSTLGSNHPKRVEVLVKLASLYSGFGRNVDSAQSITEAKRITAIYGGGVRAVTAIDL